MHGGDPAVVLLSGGLDSATALAVARERGFRPYCLTFRYGQRHVIEVEAARQVAAALGIAAHTIVDFNLRVFGGSALTADIPVPKDRDLRESLTPTHSQRERETTGVPVTYVPARNTIFLAYALAYAEVLSARDIYIGVNAVDYSGYPDCRPAFIKAFETMSNLATRAAIEGRHLTIHAPLIELSKAEIIRLGLRLGVDYAATTSCYDPAADGAACGHCDACILRRRGFEEAGVTDPTRYAESCRAVRPSP